MPSIEKLTESEEIVMKAVWECKNPPAVTEVLDIVNSIYGREWKIQTTSTYLAILVRKGYLKLIRNGKKFTYKILVKEEAYRRRLYKQHISYWNHNDIVVFVAEMIHNNDLTLEDLDKIVRSANSNKAI